RNVAQRAVRDKNKRVDLGVRQQRLERLDQPIIKLLGLVEVFVSCPLFQIGSKIMCHIGQSLIRNGRLYPFNARFKTDQQLSPVRQRDDVNDSGCRGDLLNRSYLRLEKINTLILKIIFQFGRSQGLDDVACLAQACLIVIGAGSMKIARLAEACLILIRTSPLKYQISQLSVNRTGYLTK